MKKHTKPNPMKGTTGGIVDKTMPIHQSNVAIFNAATGKADRVGIKVDGDKKVRVFKSSGASGEGKSTVGLDSGRAPVCKSTTARRSSPS